MKYQFFKCLLVMAFMGVNFSLFSQNVLLDADIKGMENRQVVMHYKFGDANKADTIIARDGKFTWTAPIPYPQKVLMSIGNKILYFFAESGKMSFAGVYDSIYSAKITGSKSNDIYKILSDRLNKKIAPVQESLRQLHNLKLADDRAQREEIARNYFKGKREATESFVAEYPDTYVALSAVQDLSGEGVYDNVVPAYNMLSENMKATPPGKELTNRMTVIKRKRVGETFKDFTVNDVDGNPVKLYNVIGKSKYVLIDFWASWCGPCRAENPNVLNAFNKYHEKGFDVIGISIDENGEAWRAAVKKDGMPWTHVSDLKKSNEVAAYYGILAIPSTMLVDSKGKIVATDIRGTSLHDKLSELLDR